MSYSYAVKVGTLKAFLERVKSKELEVPSKVTQAYLESIGYKSVNDRPIIRVLKSIKFISEDGVPTQRFSDFRTEISGQVMAQALRETYSDLFRTYANPLEKRRDDLENFFAKTKTSVKKQVLGLYVDTFKTLCEFADFKAEPIETEDEGEKKETELEREKGKLPIAKMPQGLSINMNIQITLPVTDNAEVYDKIFEALKKHIFNRS